MGKNSAWDVPRAILLYESVRHLFEYPSKSTQICWNDQISWRNICNLYLRNRPTKSTSREDVGIEAVEETGTMDLGSE
jgi:hypothetical protein